MLEWIQTPFREEPSKARLKGLWFGLFNPCPDGTPVADIYVCGSKRFEPDFNDNSWAVGPDWWPQARYASSSILADVYRIAYQVGGSDAKRKNCLGNDAEYPLCLGFGTFAVRHLLACVEPTLILGKSKSIGIAVGFDSGDFVLLGEFSRHGLNPIDPRSPKPEKSIEPVLKDLRSSDSDRAFRAVYELTRFGDRAREAISDLERLAGSSEVFLRQAALSTLAKIAPDDPRAKAVILNALEDSSPSVRREALQALISIENLTASELARIKEMENDSDSYVASWAETALRNIQLNTRKQRGKAKS